LKNAGNISHPRWFKVDLASPMVKLECIISMICELVNQGLSEQVQDSSDTRALFLRGDDHGEKK